MCGLGHWEILVIFAVLVPGLLGTVLWIWMLVECATKEANEGNEKLVWIVIIALTHWIGALIYLFIRRPRRRAELGR